ncbi:MAG: hypothetical protein Q9227_001405 [Pyrenula ochraceoflavens]
MSSQSQKCYNPDDSLSDSDQIPCAAPGSDQTNTHCCQNGATCLSNGLCLVKWDTSLNTGSCTDASWQADACFQSCLSPRLASTSTVYKCTDNNFCCSGGGNTTNCCDDPGAPGTYFKISDYAEVQNGTAFVNGYSIALNAVITAGQSTTTAVSTALATGTSLSAVHQPSSCTSEEMKIGLGVGVGLGVPLLALVLLFSTLWLRARKPSGPNDYNQTGMVYRSVQPPLPYPGMPTPAYGGPVLLEADYRNTLHEMSSEGAKVRK